MPTESCPICGDPCDADELDPHGHFSSDDDDSDDRDPSSHLVHFLILGIRKDRLACGEDADDFFGDGASTDKGSVTCAACLAAM